MRMHATNTNAIHRIKRIAPLLLLTALLIAVGVGCGSEKENAQELLELAQSHQAAGKLDDAVLTYTKAVRADPELTAGYVNRGNVKLQLGAFDGALLDYEKAIELQPDHFGAVFNSGIIHFLNGNFDRALAQYDRALELNPDNFDTHLNRGTLFFAMGQYEDAIREFTVVIEKGSDPEHAYYSRGDAYSDLGKYELALADYSHVTTNVYTPFRKWIAHHRLEQPEEAEQTIAEYLDSLNKESVPNDALAVYGYLSGNFDEEKIDGFMNEYEVQGYEEGTVAVCFYLGSAHVLKGDLTKARSYFERGTRDEMLTVSEYASMKHALSAMDALAE